MAGGPPAKNQPSRAAAYGPRVSPYALFGGIALALGLGVILLLTWGVGLNWYLAWILTWSAVTFAFYGYDKRQAVAQGLRVPEIVLHLLALIGGFLGGWAGRAYFHHKTRKPAFLIVLHIATVLNLGVFFWLLARR
jgi:uncharacterized membrane protein YsdA (DUF1294 family)